MLNKLILYPSTLCNLNCQYCFINKDTNMQLFDTTLAESFLDIDYYLDRIQKYFPQKKDLLELEFWGGEPLLKIERIYNLLHQLLMEYPYLNTFFISTNGTYSNWLEKILDFLQQFCQYPLRQFKFILQFSIDGPSNINDVNRGKNATEHLLNNLQGLIEKYSYVPNNVSLTIQFKPTLNLENIKWLNSCDDNIIEYYNFFEKNLLQLLNENNIQYNIIVPTIAMPSEATTDDGKIFKSFIQKCQKIQVQKVFKYFEQIVPYMNNCPVESTHNILYRKGSKCCMLNNGIGILPKSLVSICNEGFSHPNKIVLTDEEYLRFQQLTNILYEEQSCHYNSVLAELIINLAMAHQIESRYLQESEALRGAIFIHKYVPLCWYRNVEKTGCYSLPPIGELRLLLNGAAQLIDKNLYKETL